MAITNLKGITSIGNDQITTQLERNVIEWLNWGFLTVGGFFNVVVPQSGIYGGSQSTLRRASDPNYTSGQVWEAFRSNWVWESGINYQYSSPVDPIRVSGVTVNNTFYPSSTSGAFSHYIDYPNGRIIFNSAISTSSTVKASYSYRWVRVDNVDSEEFKQFFFNSFRSENSSFTQVGSGLWNNHPNNRVQLPAVYVEALNTRDFRGWQIGGGQIVTHTIVFHVFAEEKWQRDNIVDAIANQNNTKIKLFNTNLNYDSGLTYLGSIGSGTLTYPNKIAGANAGDLYIIDTKVKGVTSNLPLYRGQVSWECEIYRGDI